MLYLIPKNYAFYSSASKLATNNRRNRTRENAVLNTEKLRFLLQCLADRHHKQQTEQHTLNAVLNI